MKGILEAELMIQFCRLERDLYILPYYLSVSPHHLLVTVPSGRFHDEGVVLLLGRPGV